MSVEFYNPVTFPDARSISNLSDAHRKQFLLAGQIPAGRNFVSIEECFDYHEKSETKFRCELWQIKSVWQPEKALYEMWVLGDNGIVFKANEAVPTDIRMINSIFDYYPENPEDIPQVPFQEERQFAIEMEKAFYRAQREENHAHLPNQEQSVASRQHGEKPVPLIKPRGSRSIYRTRNRLIAFLLLLIFGGLIAWQWYWAGNRNTFSSLLAVASPAGFCGALFLLAFPEMMRPPEYRIETIAMIIVFVVGLLAGFYNWHLLAVGRFW